MPEASASWLPLAMVVAERMAAREGAGAGLPFTSPPQAEHTVIPNGQGGSRRPGGPLAGVRGAVQPGGVMEFVRVGQQVFRLDGVIRAAWRGQSLVLFFGEGVTKVEGEAAERVWRELLRRAERVDGAASPPGVASQVV